MNPTLEEFLTIFPEFASMGAKANFFYPLALDQVATNQFGNSYAYAVYLLTAHMMTSLTSAGSGIKTSERVGDVAISYHIIDNEEELSSTKYGIEFLRLRKSKVISTLVLGC
jgi:hypothetical protein